MSFLLHKGLPLFWIVISVFWMSACLQVNPSQTPTETSHSWLTPYVTIPATETAVIPTPMLKTPTFQPTVTPTPATYTVVKGDTMLGIALRFGITLESLMAANPEVNARILSIGTVLVIPPGEGNPVIFSSPTPLPIVLEKPNCFSTSDKGIWCFILVKNTQNEAMENLAARILLVSSHNQVEAEGIAIPPLNLIPPEQAIPLIYYFAPPLPETFIPLAELVSALPVIGGDERYLPAKLKIESEVIDPKGLQATIRGHVSLPKKSLAANQTWIVAVAYNTKGEVVGVRKWESGTVLEVGDTLQFEITVYSLGLPIERLEVFVEARP